MQERSGARFEQIEAFAAVVQHGGFAAAGRALGRDPSVVSRRIDALEARLGVRLLSRTTRRIALTEAGAAYLRRVQAILGELAAAEVEAAEGAAEPRGLLRLALPAAFSQRWIAPWLPAFVAAHPALRLELVHADHFVDLVAEGFDAAVRIGELADSSLVARRLAPFDTVLCAAPDYLARRDAPARPEDLARHACLTFPKARFWPDWRLTDGAERAIQRIGGPIVSDEGEGLLVACRAGAGIMPAPEWLIGPDLAAGRLVRVLPEWRFDHDGAVHVVLPPGRLVPAKTRAFVDRLVRAFDPVAPWLRAPGG
ncbi:LysR family transcriptional regulator [Coralloluteibacterium thermophilus]|uniref:LysR family transcriptional regulator n=1 Tax=Coralloluteibacterium thermophilum TaxID=2707049 RepID=A0ABV9NEW5_9GAMM